MKNTLEKVCAGLEKDVKQAYEEGVTLMEAEKLAAKCLGVQLQLAREIKVVDLDSRMKKHGIKAIKAQVYMEELAKHEKKPAEAFLDHAVNQSPLLTAAENDFAIADTDKEELTNFFGIFKDAHIYFRGIAKGKFE